MILFGVESRYMEKEGKKKSVNFAFHALCFFIALCFSPLYEPNVQIIGVTSGRGPGPGGDILSVVVPILLCAILYAGRYRGDFKNKPSKSVVREYNIRSVSLLLLYGLFFFTMPVLNNYFHYGIVYLNPCELLVIDGR